MQGQTEYSIGGDIEIGVDLKLENHILENRNVKHQKPQVCSVRGIPWLEHRYRLLCCPWKLLYQICFHWALLPQKTTTVNQFLIHSYFYHFLKIKIGASSWQNLGQLPCSRHLRKEGVFDPICLTLNPDSFQDPHNGDFIPK